jgi:calcineurin-like phosphoesterase family protein
MKRFFTADWHLGSQLLLDKKVMKEDVRPFKSVEKMDAAILRSAHQRAKYDDTIIHVGDLACYGKDRGHAGLEIKPFEIISKIPATFVNIRGNHDLHNSVKSVCDSMRIHLGKRFPCVSVSHYPSTDPHSFGQWLPGDIHICGHVHKKWKHFLDVKNKVLNINVGVDVWNFQIISEDELIKYIDKILHDSRTYISSSIRKS